MTAKKADAVLGSVLIWVPPEAEPKVRTSVQVINVGGALTTSLSVGVGEWDRKGDRKGEYQASSHAGDGSLMLLGL